MAAANFNVSQSTIRIGALSYSRGLFDSSGAFSKALPGIEVLSMPILRAAASDMFANPGMDYDIKEWKRLVSLVLCRLARTSPEHLTSGNVLFAAVILEAYFPVLRDAASQQKITNIKAGLIVDAELGYGLIAPYLLGSAPAPAAVQCAGDLTGNIDIVAAQVDWDGLVRNITARNCLVAALVALSKRGTITPAFRAKVIQDIRQEMNLSVYMDDTVVANVYHSFGRWVTPELAQALLSTWGSQLPNEAQRLRLILDRAGGSGLTSMIIVGKAVSLFPDFPWGRLNAFPDFLPEFTRVKIAMETVQDDGYFMYNHTANTQICKGTAYPSLVYVGKTLLESHMGMLTLRSYGGNRSAIRNKAYLDSLLKDFSDNRDARMHDQTVAPLPDLVPGVELVAIRAAILTYATLYVD